MKTINSVLGTCCFIWSIIQIFVGLWNAPYWVQATLIGVILLGIAKQFISNALNDDSSK